MGSVGFLRAPRNGDAAKPLRGCASWIRLAFGQKRLKAIFFITTAEKSHSAHTTNGDSAKQNGTGRNRFTGTWNGETDMETQTHGTGTGRERKEIVINQMHHERPEKPCICIESRANRAK